MFSSITSAKKIGGGGLNPHADGILERSLSEILFYFPRLSVFCPRPQMAGFIRFPLFGHAITLNEMITIWGI